MASNSKNIAELLNGDVTVTAVDIADDAVTTNKLATQTGNVDFADNSKIRLGTGNDLQIYHDGSNSVIKDNGTGKLIIDTDGTAIEFQKAGLETLATFETDGAVSLYHNNSSKLATTSTGINVTGNITTSNTSIVTGGRFISSQTSNDPWLKGVNSSNTETSYIKKDGQIYSAFGISLGGTGAANTLDDYEEGTWVPVVKATSGGTTLTYSSHYEFRLPGITSSTTALPYTKIGNRVFINFSIWWNTSATTRYNISLPFAYSGSEYGISGTATPFSIAADQGLGILGTTANASNFDTFVVTSGGGHSAVPYTANSEVYYFITYQTA